MVTIENGRKGHPFTWMSFFFANVRVNRIVVLTSNSKVFILV